MRSPVLLALGAALTLSRGAGGQPAPAAPAEAVLRLRFRPQSTARYTAHSVQRARVRGRDVRTATRVSFTVATGAVRDDGVAERSIRVSEAALDAGALTPAARARVLRGLRSVVLRYRESPRGEIRGRELGGAESPGAEGLVDAMMQSFDAYLPLLPERALRVGARWSSRREITAAPIAGSRVSLRCEVEFTLRELRRDGAAVLGLTANLAAPEGATVAGVPFRGEGRATGEAVLDLRAGLLRESTVRGDFTSRLTVRGAEVLLPTHFEDELRLLGARPR